MSYSVDSAVDSLWASEPLSCSASYSAAKESCCACSSAGFMPCAHAITSKRKVPAPEELLDEEAAAAALPVAEAALESADELLAAAAAGTGTLRPASSGMFIPADIFSSTRESATSENGYSAQERRAIKPPDFRDASDGGSGGPTSAQLWGVLVRCFMNERW